MDILSMGSNVGGGKAHGCNDKSGYGGNNGGIQFGYKGLQTEGGTCVPLSGGILAVFNAIRNKHEDQRGKTTVAYRPDDCKQKEQCHTVITNKVLKNGSQRKVPYKQPACGFYQSGGRAWAEQPPK